MCRLFASAGKLTENDVVVSLKEFRRVSKLGATPPVPNINRGHTEGWGLVAYKDGDTVYEKKRKAFAFKDPEFLYSIPRLAIRHPDIVMAHVRKMTYGMLASRNNHPFVFGPYSFAHNGSVDTTEKLPLKSYFKESIKGTTDSERLFAYFLQLLYAKKKRSVAEVRSCFKALISYIHKHHDYTAMNLVLSDSTHLWIYRDFNQKNALVKKYDLESYFSLYYGIREGSQLSACSERMKLKGIQWQLLDNKHGIEFDIKTRRSMLLDWSK